MSDSGKPEKLSAHETLIREGLVHEKRIKSATAVRNARMWAYGDWLVENTIVMTLREASMLTRGGQAPGLTCAEYARRSTYSNIMLSKYRRAAASFPPDVRGAASISLCDALLAEFKGDVAAAIQVLPERVQAVEDSMARRGFFAPELRARAAISRAERVGVRSFTDAIDRLSAAERFIDQGLRFIVEKERWTDDEWQKFVERMSRIDAKLGQAPVERPKRRRFPWLRAAA